VHGENDDPLGPPPHRTRPRERLRSPITEHRPPASHQSQSWREPEGELLPLPQHRLRQWQMGAVGIHDGADRTFRELPQSGVGAYPANLAGRKDGPVDNAVAIRCDCDEDLHAAP
jgi:hypothetical protein